jgi:hypothetical protein
MRVAAEGAGDAEGGLAEQLQVVAGEHVEGVEAEAVEQVDPAVVIEGQGVAAAEGQVGGDDAGGQVDEADRAGDAVGGGDGEARGREDLAAAGLARTGGACSGSGAASLSPVCAAVSSPSSGGTQASARLAARTCRKGQERVARVIGLTGSGGTGRGRRG